MARATPRIPYEPALDGLRALAVLGVLCFHSGWSWASGGFLGVSAFFTLSGYLITRLLLADWEVSGGIDLRGFWGRRFRRLMPAALVGIGMIVVAGLSFDPPRDGPSFGFDALSSLTYVSNWRFIATGYDYDAIFRDPSPLQHFWSLGIEEQFYLVHPLLVLALLGVTRGRTNILGGVIACAALASTALAWLHFVPGEPVARSYYGSDARAAELLVGAMLAIARARRADASFGGAGLQLGGWLALIALGAIWVNAEVTSAWLYRGGLLGHAVGVALVLAAVSAPGALGDLLSVRALRGIGRISYGIYVYHWPIFLWLDEASTGLHDAPLFALRIIATFVLATASYLWLERPIREASALPGLRGAFAAALAMGLLVLLLGIGWRVWPVAESHGGLGDVVEESDAEAAARDGRPVILVVGDSIGRNLGRALKRWGNDTGRAKVLVRARPACGLAHGGEYQTRSGAVADEQGVCHEALEEWRRVIAQVRPEIVLVSTGGLDLVERRLPGWVRFEKPGDARFDEWLVAEYVARIDLFAHAGAQVVWPTWPCVGEREFQGRLQGTDAFTLERVRHLNEVVLPRVQGRRPDLRVVDIFTRVCPDGEFTRALGPTEHARADGLHFDKEEARWLAAWLGPEVLRAADVSEEGESAP